MDVGVKWSGVEWSGVEWSLVVGSRGGIAAQMKPASSRAIAMRTTVATTQPAPIARALS
jgi:hypothetical protein